ncbi:MAG TPA: hypothetical protein VFH29_01465, partial [Anaerolineales bacterium]|nr:hypothetical protein [Anaerolineales bacterium]
MQKPLKVMALGLIVVATLACGALAPVTGPAQDVSTIVAETLAAITMAAPAAADTPAPPAGTSATFPGGSLVIPDGVATGISSETIPAVVGQQDSPWWELAPEHVRVSLQGYALQGKFHEAQIIVFPAVEYAALNESAAANVQTLQAIASNPNAIPAAKDLPHITFFNAGPVFQSQVAVVSFQGGKGI